MDPRHHPAHPALPGSGPPLNSVLKTCLERLRNSSIKQLGSLSLSLSTIKQSGARALSLSLTHTHTHTHTHLTDDVPALSFLVELIFSVPLEDHQNPFTVQHSRSSSCPDPEAKLRPTLLIYRKDSRGLRKQLQREPGD